MRAGANANSIIIAPHSNKNMLVTILCGDTHKYTTPYPNQPTKYNAAQYRSTCNFPQ